LFPPSSDEKNEKKFCVRQNETVRVTFIPLRISADAKPNETILDVARRASAPIGNSCGAVGVCARCRVTIVSGAENVTPMTAVEMRTAERTRFVEGERLACQAVVAGDCAVRAAYW
jgi:2Fe-2S ferredoxin